MQLLLITTLNKPSSTLARSSRNPTFSRLTFLNSRETAFSYSGIFKQEPHSANRLRELTYGCSSAAPAHCSSSRGIRLVEPYSAQVRPCSKNGYVGDPVRCPTFDVNACCTAQESAFMPAITGDNGLAQFSASCSNSSLPALRFLPSIGNSHALPQSPKPKSTSPTPFSA